MWKQFAKHNRQRDEALLLCVEHELLRIGEELSPIAQVLRFSLLWLRCGVFTSSSLQYSGFALAMGVYNGAGD